jgi:Ca2+-binding EF-hand superfamily protein
MALEKLPLDMYYLSLEESEVPSEGHVAMTSKDKEEEITALFDGFRSEENDFVSCQQAVTILKTLGIDQSLVALRPFFDTFVMDEDEVKLQDLKTIMDECLFERRRARSFGIALRKIDSQRKGHVSASDAINILSAMTSETYKRIMKEKQLLILDHSRFDYQVIDLNTVVRRFHC